jgi:hypothetical protein
LDLGGCEGGKRAKSRERHSSFIIRVVNFMTGWIPDSPPSPFSYFIPFSSLYQTISLFFLFISALYFVVASLDVLFFKIFICLLTVGFSILHSVPIHIAIERRWQNFSIPEFRNRKSVNLIFLVEF